MAIFAEGQKRDFKTSISDRRDSSKIVQLLREGEVISCRMMPAGSNLVFLLTLRKNSDTILAIYKPRRGEVPLWDFPDGSLYRREMAAYLVSGALGWRFIPPTELREGPYGIGMMQQFIPARLDVSHYRLVRKYAPELKRIAVFDWLVNNADRKVGHCLEGDDGRIWGIDHGLTFNYSAKMRTVIWDFSGQMIPRGLVEDLYRLKEELNGRGDLRKELSGLITADEIQSLEKRLCVILERPVFPAWSGLYRSIPWPPY